MKSIIKNNIIIAALFSMNSFIGLLISNQQYFILLTGVIFFIVFRVKGGVILALPYVFFSPIAAMSGVPLFFICILMGFVVVFLNMAKYKGDIFSKNEFYWVLVIVMYLLFEMCSTFFSLDAFYSMSAMVIIVQSLLLVILMFFYIRDVYSYYGFLISYAFASLLSLFVKIFIFMHDESPVLLQNAAMQSIDWQSRAQYYIDGEFVKRLLWLGQEPNYTAALHIFPVAIGFYLYRKLSFLSWRFVFILISMANMIQEVGTMSRSGTLLSSGLLLFLSMTKATLKQRIIGSFVFLISLVVFYSKFDYFFIRLWNVADSVKDDGANGRFDMWEKALDLWGEHPLIGIGPGIFYLVTGDAAHNTYLQSLVEGGILGGGMLFFVYIYPLIKFNKVRLNELQLGLVFFLLMIATITYQQLFITLLIAFLVLKSVKYEHFHFLKGDIK